MADNSRPLMEKIKEMESQRELSIQTERANRLNEDDETHTIESWSVVLKREMSTLNRRSWELIGTILLTSFVQVSNTCEERTRSNAHKTECTQSDSKFL